MAFHMVCCVTMIVRKSVEITSSCLRPDKYVKTINLSLFDFRITDSNCSPSFVMSISLSIIAIH